MNLNRLVNMVMRQLTRKLMKKGLNGSVDAASRKRANASSGPHKHGTSKTQKTAMRTLRRITRL